METSLAMQMCVVIDVYVAVVTCTVVDASISCDERCCEHLFGYSSVCCYRRS